MDAVATAAPPRRRWLDQLIAEPAAQVRALVEGTADIAPLGRAEPRRRSDAAVRPRRGRSGDAGIRRGDACDAGGLRQACSTSRAQNGIGRRSRPLIYDCHSAARAAADRRRFASALLIWNNWAETLVLDEGFDLRREYRRLLALTQDVAKEAGLEP